MTDDIVTRPPHDDCMAHGWSNAWEYDCTCDLIYEIERLRAERDHYERIAEEAVANLEQAVKLLQAFQAAVHD